jgi:methylglutamate dehydrogenase subunit C
MGEAGMRGPYRLAAGGSIDRTKHLDFTFDGRTLQGHPGDTLASALLANGVRVVARSFKYHRPRGLYSAGPEEPNALVTLRRGGRREANVPATMVELYDGLVAESQNRWPSLSLDLGAVNGALAPLLPAGFYYKTFMWPAAFWERLYEPLIRRAAGLGRIASAPDPDRYETIHAHCETLVVGGGRTGRRLAQVAARSGGRVILAEQDFGPIEGPGPEATVLGRTTVIGLYDHGVAAALERVADHRGEPGEGQVRQRLWIIRAAEIVVATGAVERLIPFPGNDRPGVMLASAAARYASRFGVACGRQAVVVLDNDEARASVDALSAAGVKIAATIDLRRGEAVLEAIGAPVRAVEVRRGGRTERIETDLVCVSGGFTAQTQLARMARGDGRVRLAGRAAREDRVSPRQVKSIGALAFVDLQNDVTVDDLRLAHREGYSHVEHMKRYTTHGMGTDQGKIGGLVGSAVLAALRGEEVETVGLPAARPYATPASWGALAGAEVGAHFRPERRLPLHDWHKANGATFAKLGLWLRPLVYSGTGDTGWGSVLEEARAVRQCVGLSDVSSLGKIDVQGRDAATFLDRIYANTISTLPPGRARYGLMLREDGIVFDDGTVARLGETHFLLSTTTANAAAVLEHMEFHHETVWPELDVRLTSVSDQWAQFAVAGPKARAVMATIVERDMADAAFPFMAAGEAPIAGVAGRLFRISFSGELAYEVAVPAHRALPVWGAILAAGAPHDIRPYGLDALNLLRIEKGHVAGSEINGQTTARDLGLGRMLKRQGDFVGRVLGERPGLRDPGRLALVGLSVADPAASLRAGAHLVAHSSPRASQGYVTAACPRSEGEGFIGLALLAGGASRIGERLLATDPVRGQHCDVEIVPPHFVDPENERVRDPRGVEPVPREKAGATKTWVSNMPDQAARSAMAGISVARLERDVVEVVAPDAMGPGSEAQSWRVAPSRTLFLRRRLVPGAFADEVRGAAAQGSAVIDQSGAYVAYRLSGEKTRWVLSKICRLDLHPRSFGQQSVARTIIAQVPVIVYCVGAEGIFDLLVPRSFAHAFLHVLTTSAADVGISIEDETP